MAVCGIIVSTCNILGKLDTYGGGLWGRGRQLMLGHRMPEHSRRFIFWWWGVANNLDSQSLDARDRDLIRILTRQLHTGLAPCSQKGMVTAYINVRTGDQSLRRTSIRQAARREEREHSLLPEKKQTR